MRALSKLFDSAIAFLDLGGQALAQIVQSPFRFAHATP